LLCLRGFSGGCRRPPFFSRSRVGGKSNGLFGGTLLINGPCFGRGDRGIRRGESSFRGGTTLFRLRGFGYCFLHPLFFDHTCVDGSSNGLLGGRPSGSRCLGHGEGSFRGSEALLCLRGFSGGFRCPPFFSHSGVGGNSNRLLGGALLRDGLCFRRGGRSFCRGESSFRGGATLFRLGDFGERVRGALFFGHPCVGGNSNGLLGGTLQSGSPRSRRSNGSFGGGAPFLGFRGFGGRFRGALFFRHSRVGGGSSGLFELLDGSVCIRSFGLGLGPSRCGCGDSGIRRSAALLCLCRFSGGLRSALFHGHPRVVGGSRGLFSGMLLSGGPCFRRGVGRFRGDAALFRLCCFGDGFRGALFFGDSRVSGRSDHLFDGSVRVHGFGLGLGPSRFRGGAALVRLC